CFFDKLIDLDDTDYWFDFDVLGCAETRNLDSIADLSCPTNPSPADRDPLLVEQDPLREARQLDEGVCTSNDPIGCSVSETNSTLPAPQYCEFVLYSLVPVSAGQPSPPCEIWKDAEIVDTICREGPADRTTPR
ncbi:uncharacterized protein VP01_7229g1, partial [Puccinia sorghi]